MRARRQRQVASANYLQHRFEAFPLVFNKTYGFNHAVGTLPYLTFTVSVLICVSRGCRNLRRWCIGADVEGEPLTSSDGHTHLLSTVSHQSTPSSEPRLAARSSIRAWRDRFLVRAAVVAGVRLVCSNRSTLVSLTHPSVTFVLFPPITRGSTQWCTSV